MYVPHSLLFQISSAQVLLSQALGTEMDDTLKEATGKSPHRSVTGTAHHGGGDPWEATSETWSCRTIIHSGTKAQCLTHRRLHIDALHDQKQSRKLGGSREG